MSDALLLTLQCLNQQIDVQYRYNFFFERWDPELIESYWF